VAAGSGDRYAPPPAHTPRFTSHSPPHLDLESKFPSPLVLQAYNDIVKRVLINGKGNGGRARVLCPVF
jgi:hypothetical protein